MNHLSVSSAGSRSAVVPAVVRYPRLMFKRLLCTLLSLWLLAGPFGMGAHVHAHEHPTHALHEHVALEFDGDHLRAHVDGAIDRDCAGALQQAAAELPELGPGHAATMPTAPWPPVVWTIEPARPSPSRGPPEHIRPPSQAPPLPPAFA